MFTLNHEHPYDSAVEIACSRASRIAAEVARKATKSDDPEVRSAAAIGASKGVYEALHTMKIYEHLLVPVAHASTPASACSASAAASGGHRRVEIKQERVPMTSGGTKRKSSSLSTPATVEASDEHRAKAIAIGYRLGPLPAGATPDNLGTSVELYHNCMW